MLKRLTYAGVAALLLIWPFSSLYGAELIGAGATFPFPFYAKAFDEYHKQTGVKINYQAIGSGGGVRQLTNKTVDFGASDAFLTDEALAEMSSPVLHIPTVLGAVSLTYNLPEVSTLRLTPEVIEGIYTGRIKKWNDARIQSTNPDVKLPNKKIVVVHRSDGSGTTFIFTDYLSKISKVWREKVGAGNSVKWPLGLGGKGNAGVAGLVKQIPGSVGYIELVYALQNEMPVASVRNAAGHFIAPDLNATSLAAQVDLPADTRVSLTNTAAEGGYPLSGFTWILVYQDQAYGDRTVEDARSLYQLLRWLVRDGQKYAQELGYAPLSDQARQKAEAVIASMRFQGKPLGI